jgi:hypothetical protein
MKEARQKECRQELGNKGSDGTRFSFVLTPLLPAIDGLSCSGGQMFLRSGTDGGQMPHDADYLVFTIGLIPVCF